MQAGEQTEAMVLPRAWHAQQGDGIHHFTTTSPAADVADRLGRIAK
jgi:hypothetical protein